MTDVTQASSRRNSTGASSGPTRSKSQKKPERMPSSPATAKPSGDGPDNEQTSDIKEDLISHAELLFFAYRDFISEPDEILATFGFGRAHHRVLHFVHRTPGLRVAQLLNILKITKQSLARVLKQLIDEGFVIQRAGKMDGRERLLYVTSKGAKLADELAALQVARIKFALEQAGPGGEEASRRFLFAMISEDEQQNVAALIAKPCDPVSSDDDPTNT